MSSSKELVVSQNRHATKLGILEDGQLVEVYFQRADEYSLAGSIHKGRVTRVLPGMQSAFVDLGLERDCFLYVSDFFDEHGEEIDRVEDKPAVNRGPSRDRDRERGRDRDPRRDQRREPLAPRPVVEAVAPVIEASPALSEQEAAPGAGEDSVDPRRRSRRRRKGRGFPESKYAEASDTAEADQPVDEAAADGVGSQGPGEARGIEDLSSDVIILPGESLAKYRRAATRRDPEVADEASAADVDEVAYEAAADDAVESILDRIDALERGEEVDLPAADDEEDEDEGPQDEVEGSPDQTAGADDDEGEDADIEVTASFEVDENDLDDSAETDPAGEESPVPLAVEEGDEDGWVGISLEVDSRSARIVSPEGTSGELEVGAGDAAAEVSSEETVPAEEGAEPARMPVSLTATLRAQGGRLGHRTTRRSRRRGRGGERVTVETAIEAPEAEAGAAPEVAVSAEPAVVTRPPAEVRLPRGRDRDRDRENGEKERQPTSISDLLKEGQEIIVQIAKEPLGQKGARITSHIALPGRYVVYMPTIEHMGVSRKISTEEERQRLKKVLQRQREGLQGGYIMRTAGEGRTEEEIGADMRYLAALWKEIREKAEKRRAPLLLHHDVEIVERILRDHLTGGFKAIWVDHEELYEQVLHTVERFSPQLLNRVKLYTRPEPIFDAFGITQELEKALRPKVWLKSGGYIVINQTEALVAIDVNTGKYVGKSHRLEDTITKTNTEAVKEIVRQIRLRDLGGIIVVDFIDMDERKNRQKVMQVLEETMRLDKAPYKILQFNDFGLVAITRKRVKQSLERALCSPCPNCEGSGYVKSVETVIGEILNQAQKYAKVVDGQECVLRVNPEVAALLKSLKNNYLEELEEILGRPVMVISDPEIHQDKYDLT